MVQMPGGEIWEYNSGDVSILIVRGELDLALSNDLRDRLDGALSNSPAALLVDLEETSFMDASALGILLSAFQRARTAGVDLRLVAPVGAVERLLRLTETDDLLPIERDLISAYARIAV